MLLLEDKLDKIINIASRFIPEDFGCWDEDEYIYNGLDEDIYRELKKIDADVRIENGVTKMVIIPSFGDKVIKIPFTGYYCSSYEEDGDYPFVPFEMVYNYCQKECEVYDTAIENDMAPLFAGTTFYKTVNNIDFYLQEKVARVGGYIAGSSSDKSDSYRNASNMGSTIIRDIYWLAEVINYYGEDIAQCIVNYIDSNSIYDLHGGNVGYRANGEPVLFDYSGYED